MRSTTGVRTRRKRKIERGREGRLGSRWSRVRNETILSSRGREGRGERGWGSSLALSVD